MRGQNQKRIDPWEKRWNQPEREDDTKIPPAGTVISGRDWWEGGKKAEVSGEEGDL